MTRDVERAPAPEIEPMLRRFLRVLLIVLTPPVIVLVSWRVAHVAHHVKLTRLGDSLGAGQILGRSIDGAVAEAIDVVLGDLPHAEKRARLADLDATVEDALDRYAGLLSEPEDLEAMASLRLLHDRLRAQLDARLAEPEARDATRRQDAIELRSLEQSIEREIGALGRNRTARLGDGLRRTYDGVVVVALLAVLIGCLIPLALLVTLRGRVLVPLASVLETAGRIRRGDLKARAVATARDEMGQLAREINFMAESLADSRTHLEEKVRQRTREAREMQKLLVRSEKMSAVDRLAGGVAHELNNPLTAILGYAELVRDDLARSEGRARAVGWINSILRETQRCRRIVADLQQFVRGEESARELFRLDEAVRRAVEVGGYGSNAPAIRVEILDDGSCPVMLGSSLKIELVVLALVSNAIEALAQGGGSGSVWVDVRSEDERAVIEVRDDGPGILEPERVFDPFYTTKDVGGGPGLGLSVCYGIVREHRGTIRADNWALGGRVRVDLPLRGGNGDPAGTSLPEPDRVQAEGAPPVGEGGGSPS